MMVIVGVVSVVVVASVMVVVVVAAVAVPVLWAHVHWGITILLFLAVICILSHFVLW